MGELDFTYEGGMSQEEVRRVTREILGLLRNNSDIKLLPRPDEPNDDNSNPS